MFRNTFLRLFSAVILMFVILPNLPIKYTYLTFCLYGLFLVIRFRQMGKIALMDRLNFNKLIRDKSRGIETTLKYNQILVLFIGAVFFFAGLIGLLA